MDKIPFEKIVNICLPSDDDKLFIIVDKEQNNYHYKSNDKEKWANLIKDSNAEIKITSSINDGANTNTNDDSNNINNINSNNGIRNTLNICSTSNSSEITTNVNVVIEGDDDLENDLSIAPIFDYAPRYNNTHTDSEIEPPQTIENYDYSILEEIDFYILDLVNGYLRDILRDKNNNNNNNDNNNTQIQIKVALKMPPKIQDLCALFYFIRKFDTRRLRRDCDF